MNHVKNSIKTIEPNDSIKRYSSLGVNCIQGEASLVSPWEISVNDKIISTEKIILATGGYPQIPAILGIEDIPYLTSDSLWDLNHLPKNLLIIGGGPIGCELAQAFSRLGSSVTIVQRNRSLIPKEDKEASQVLLNVFENENIKVLTCSKVLRLKKSTHGAIEAKISHNAKETTLEFSHLLVAVGRKAHSDINGIEKLSLTKNEKGALQVNGRLQTRFPNIYAVEDLIGPPLFTHSASHEAWHAAVNSLFGNIKAFSVNYSLIPRVTYTSPEIAQLGLTEHEAKAQGKEYEVVTVPMSEVDRSICEENTEGFLKILTLPRKDTILGVTIVADKAGELLAQFSVAMKAKKGLNHLLGVIYSYPTEAEVAKKAAGVWKNRNKPKRALKALSWYFKIKKR